MDGVELIEKRYTDSVCRSKLKKIGKFTPVWNYVARYGRYSFGHPRHVGTYSPLAIISDIDYTLTRENVFEKIVGYLRNKRLKQVLPKLARLFRILSCKADEGRCASEVIRIIRKTELRKEDFLQAKEKAIKEVKLRRGVHETFRELKRMGFTIMLNSGEPTEVASDIALKRLGIPQKFVDGSIWEWKDGYFSSLKHNLGFHKATAMKKRLNSMDCGGRMLGIWVDDVDAPDHLIKHIDEYNSETPMFSRAGIRLVVGVIKQPSIIRRIKKVVGIEDAEWFFEDKRFPDTVYIGSSEFGEDLTRILEPIKIWVIGLLTAIRYDPRTYSFMLECVQQLREFGDRILSGGYRIADVEKFLEISSNVRNDFSFIYPLTVSEIDEKIESLREIVAEGEGNYQTLVSQILDEFRRYLAEFHFDSNDLKTIKDYVSVQEELFRGYWPRRVI